MECNGKETIHIQSCSNNINDGANTSILTSWKEYTIQENNLIFISCLLPTLKLDLQSNANNVLCEINLKKTPEHIGFHPTGEP